jgi:hypothetical protein
MVGRNISAILRLLYTRDCCLRSMSGCVGDMWGFGESGVSIRCWDRGQMRRADNVSCCRVSVLNGRNFLMRHSVKVIPHLLDVVAYHSSLPVYIYICRSHTDIRQLYSQREPLAGSSTGPRARLSRKHFSENYYSDCSASLPGL